MFLFSLVSLEDWSLCWSTHEFKLVVKETCSDELAKKIKASFERMSASFSEPAKAEECFYKLDQMKDNYIFNSLAQLLDEASIIKARHARVRCHPYSFSGLYMYSLYHPSILALLPLPSC